jgi:uncharacterized protein HemX
MGAISTEIKLAIAAVLAVIILGLGWVAVHYHGAWVESKEEVSKLKAEQAQLSTSAKNCSDGTSKLEEDSKKKEEQVRKAQAQAAALAKNNEALAQALLNAKPEGEVCAAAVKLYQGYKNKGEKK